MILLSVLSGISLLSDGNLARFGRITCCPVLSAAVQGRYHFANYPKS